MDIDSPKSEPEKSYEKPNTEKAGKDGIASKPDDKPKNNKIDYKDKKIETSSQKPKDKPKNKIEPRKIDIQKEPRNKIQRQKSNHLTPPRNKIQRQKSNHLTPPRNKIQRQKSNHLTPPRNKIQRQKSNPLTPPRNKIKPRKMDIRKEPEHRIQPQRSKNKIERNPASEPKNSANPEVSQLSLEKIKGELKKFNWKTISENWTVKVSANKEITLKPYELPSKENPLYKHKQWLQTVYKHKTWNLNDNMLRKISGVSNGTIYSWRNKLNIPTKQPKQKLFRDGKRKECGRCHQIKSHNEFKVRNDKRKDNPYLRSNCNQCKNELNQIYLFKNKRKILTNIYNGKFKEKCPECETKVSKLPAFDFHHPDRSLKEEQRIRTYGNWTKTMEKLEKEKVIPLCKNCHAIKQATTYNKYKEIILKRNDFEKKFEGMEKNIHQYMRTHLKYQKYDQIRQIKPWIKKRIVTENLYNGKCVGCDEEKLPTLQFHHKDPKQKTYEKWSDLSNLNIRKIMKKLKEDNAVCLCANCHSMTESSQFKENINKIIEKRDIPELKTFYKRLSQNIKDFSFPNQPELQNKNMKKLENNLSKEKTNNQKMLSSTNLQLSEKKESKTQKDFNEQNLNGNLILKNHFGYGEAWKKYLFHIEKLLSEGKTVHTKTLAESVGVNTRNTRKSIQKLLNKGLITINGVHNNRTIILTENGRKETIKVKKK